jgi:hypothetical protein
MSRCKKFKKKNAKQMFRKDTTSRGHQRELARKGRPRSQLWVPTCGGMSTDGPQPTQGAPKKKKGKESRSVVFWDCFFCPFFFFGGPLTSAYAYMLYIYIISGLFFYWPLTHPAPARGSLFFWGRPLGSRSPPPRPSTHDPQPRFFIKTLLTWTCFKKNAQKHHKTNGKR